MTLLENLCLVDKCQGGNINQYCDVFDKSHSRFKGMWEKIYEDHGALMDKQAFVELAALADYEGLIWRARKKEERELSRMNEAALESYFSARGYFRRQTINR